MKMLFEVNDLNAASPATVSRLGVVYVPPETVGISAIYLTWCAHIMEHRWPFMESEVRIDIHYDIVRAGLASLVAPKLIQ